MLPRHCVGGAEVGKGGMCETVSGKEVIWDLSAFGREVCVS